jgi:hypothetical protein
VWISGTVTDAQTGKPVEGEIQYRPSGFNSDEDKVPGYVPRGLYEHSSVESGPDGKFKVLGVPGKGYVLVRAYATYLTADFADWQGDLENPAPKTYVPSSPVELAMNYSAVCMVTADREKAAKEYAIKLDPGVTPRGTLIDQEGRPVVGVLTSSVWNASRIPLPTAEFTFKTFNPKRPYAALFLHSEKKLGLLFRPEVGKTGPFTVQLQPTASATGRILDADDRPIANAPLRLLMSLDGNAWEDSWFHRDKVIKTDANGQFMIEHLVEGESYEIRWPLPAEKRQEGHRDFTVKTGEKKDLGNIKHKSEPEQ